MASTARVALLGFSRMERATFEAFFRMAAKRSPAYAQEADPRAADFIIVDAADAAACAQLRGNGLVKRAIVIGEPPCEGALLQLGKPLNLTAVVRALDAHVVRPDAEGQAGAGMHVTAVQLEVRSGRGAGKPRPGAAAPATVPAAPHRAKKPRELATTVHARLGADTALDVPADMRSGAGARRRPRMDHILVVDDSDIALRFMTSHLQRFGFQIHLAQSGEEALKRVAERHFEFIFMDVMMEGLDGFQTCKTIKRATYREGHKPPMVVMLTGRGAAVDKLRGTMAGADAYLTKPLREVELLKLVGEREIERHAYAQTGVATTV